MFSTIKSMWKQARADEATKEAADLIDRYEQLGGYERYEMASAFDYSKTELEDDGGKFSSWSRDAKLAMAKQLMDMAREGLREIPYGSYGGALLSLYLEAQTLPGPQAQALVETIENWHMRAVERDIKPRP